MRSPPRPNSCAPSARSKTPRRGRDRRAGGSATPARVDMIHPTAIVHPGARVATDIEIGPYSVIGPHVEIGPGCRVGPHAVITGHTRLGENNRIYQFVSLGEVPQDKKYAGEPTRLEIGNNN